MTFGLAYNTAYYGADLDPMAAVVQHAEKCGFESFYTSEHIVMYPGRPRVQCRSGRTWQSPIRWHA